MVYNQPRFSSCTYWNPKAITVAKNDTIGYHPYTVFVDIKNTIYVRSNTSNQILIWRGLGTNVMRTMNQSSIYPGGMFISFESGIYVTNENNGTHVESWAANATVGVAVMNVNSSCYSLFVDLHSTLYCSLDTQHMVMKHLLNAETNSTIVAAGNGTAGSTPDMLNSSRGIYVDRTFRLYVADCGNDRVQLFPLNQRNATTVAGNGAPGAISLNCPIGITLDFDGYMFIVDCFNHRIIGSGLNGFRCIAGCSNQSGAQDSQLSNPRSMAFDTDGNILVADTENDRIQKFMLTSNTCGNTFPGKLG